MLSSPAAVRPVNGLRRTVARAGIGRGGHPCGGSVIRLEDAFAQSACPESRRRGRINGQAQGAHHLDLHKNQQPGNNRARLIKKLEIELVLAAADRRYPASGLYKTIARKSCAAPPEKILNKIPGQLCYEEYSGHL